ncbi:MULTISPECIES: YccF domain-containing protein [Gordonia]|uniref:YccF domain-containing protein n=1 Tax=Gordonia TaxID=2053 RepID=UPI003262FE64
MKTILNVLWLVLCGLWMAIGYAVAGIICCLLIITIPFGIASFRMADYALWPFGRTVIRRPEAGAASTLGNIIWIVVAGIWLAIGHLATGVALCITIIGIPLGIASFKMIPISLVPLGAQIVSTSDPRVAY